MKNLLNEKRRMKNEKLHSETILNSSSVYRGRVEILRLVATVCTLVCTLAACAPDGIDDTHSNGQHDALEAMDPETAVRLRTTLQAFGGENTENKTRANDGSPDLAAIPAWNEVTAETVIVKLPEAGHDLWASDTRNSDSKLTANASLQLPGATDETNSMLRPSQEVTVGNLEDVATWNNYTESSDPFTLRLRHFNLKDKDAAGTRQPHSRLGILTITGDGSYDYLYDIARLAGSAPGFIFRLRHASAKLSVLVETKTADGSKGTPLDMTNADVLAEAYISTGWTSIYPIYISSDITSADGSPAVHADLMRYLTTSVNGNYPDDPTDPAAQTGMAIYNLTPQVYQKFPLRHPTTGTTGITVPANLISGIVSASVTHAMKDEGEDEDGYDIYAYSLLNADGTPERYSTSTAEADRDKDVLVLKLNNILDGGSGTESTTTATYRLPLTSIALTGLSADDPRCDTGSTADAGGKYPGHLLYLRPGEHLTLTVTVDRNRIVSATGTIGTWSDATVDEDLTGDENKETIK
ncbi:MAG: hypothetical protein V8Q76_07235 [Bacteroides intestinalis]